ncbi:head maturation protease, ClpP-related [Thauera aromatica]|uniref:head maturation protease, ClpP-related n=1 Tax=Thauera aromatica TaxID=59405 RepID=UPI001FFDACE3|nr:head maturation protease, ClpP-related [Thauera aromatica]MCK2095224.1 Clp protease ClpP [Thauera aromatica]
MPNPIAINLAADGMRAEIILRGWIGVDWMNTADALGAQLLDSVTHITVRINSLGGLAHEGIAMHNILKAHPAHVLVIIEGVAGSAASVVAMAGDEVAMYPNSLMMIHAIKMVEADDWGNAVETPEAAAASRAYNAALLATYTARTGKSADDIAALLATDTWMTAAEAIAGGFADRIEPYAAAPADAPAQPVNATLAALAAAVGIPEAVVARVSAAAIEPATSEGGDPQPAAGHTSGDEPPPAPDGAQGAAGEGASAAPGTGVAAGQDAPFAETISALAAAAGLRDYVATWLLAEDIATVESAQAAIAQAREVRALCEAVGTPDMAANLIRARATPADARRSIAAALAAAADRQQIRNHLPVAPPPSQGARDVWAKVLPHRQTQE